jgi:hypothetical protein
VRRTLRPLLIFVVWGCGSGGGGDSAATADRSAAGVTIDLRADAVAVKAGESVWVSWTATKATACEAAGGWTGTQAISGAHRSAPLTAPTSFVLSCHGKRGGAVAQVAVDIAADESGGVPRVTLSSANASVPYNGNTRLVWQADGARSCRASGGWTGPRPTRGSERVAGLRANTSFVLTCEGDSGAGVAMTQVLLQRARLRWEAPGAETGGAIAGFRIDWGTRAERPERLVALRDAKVREHVLDLPGSGTYHFLVVSLDAAARELARSNVVTKVLPH